MCLGLRHALSTFFDQFTNKGVTLYDTIHHPKRWSSDLISRSDSLLQTWTLSLCRMVDRWLGSLQSVRANDDQTSHHTLSDRGDERKTRWWETEVELIGVWAEQRLILVSGCYRWLTSVLAVLLEHHSLTVCLNLGTGSKYSRSVYKQQTETGLFMNIHYSPSLHTLHLPILKSPAEKFQTKREYKIAIQNVRHFKPKFALNLNIQHNMDSYQGPSGKP